MLDTNTEIVNQDIACLVSKAGPILYMFLKVLYKNKLAVRSHICVISFFFIYKFCFNVESARSLSACPECPCLFGTLGALPLYVTLSKMYHDNHSFNQNINKYQC